MNVTIDFFGKKATDRVTGFTGIATGVAYHMYGCEQVCITPPVGENGARRDGEWFDIGRLEFGEEVVSPDSVKAERDGCEHRDNGPSR